MTRPTPVHRLSDHGSWFVVCKRVCNLGVHDFLPGTLECATSHIEKSFTELANSDDEFTIRFRGQFNDVTGVDLGAPTEGPPPAVLVDWTS